MNGHCRIVYEVALSKLLQIVAITMVALALSEDSIAQWEHRDTIIESLTRLPDSIREVQ